MNDTRKFLDNVLAGKSAESRTQFDGVMSQKMNAALDLRKVSLTSELFGKNKVAEETLKEGKMKLFADPEVEKLRDEAKALHKKVGSKADIKDIDVLDEKGLRRYIKWLKATQSGGIKGLLKAVFTKEDFGEFDDTLTEGTSKEDLIAQAMKWDKEAGFANEYSDFADSSIKDLKAYIKFAKGEAADLKKLKSKRK